MGSSAEQAMPASERTLEQAVSQRAEYLRENSGSVTMAGARRLIEEDLGLPRNALDSCKETLRPMVDAAFATTRSHPATKRPAEQSAAKASKGRKSRKRKSTSTSAGSIHGPGLGSSKRAQRLKESVRTAGIGVPPTVFKKAESEDELCDMLVQVLEREGLSEKSRKDELKQVKQRRDIEKELEGIDSSNIVSTPRSGRATRRTLRNTTNQQDEQGEELPGNAEDARRSVDQDETEEDKENAGRRAAASDDSDEGEDEGEEPDEEDADDEDFEVDGQDKEEEEEEEQEQQQQCEGGMRMELHNEGEEREEEEESAGGGAPFEIEDDAQSEHAA
jgi:hypothetical protein